MKYLDETSLAKTVDHVHESLFFKVPIPTNEKERVANWLVSRLGQRGSYGGLIAPTETDFSSPAVLFTGEKLKSGASTAHILGEEAMQALKLLKTNQPEVLSAIEKSKLVMEGILKREEQKMGHKAGMFCCGTCSVAYWRSLTTGCLDHAEERLSIGLKTLKSLRDGKGKWRRFPYYYTLLALSSINLPDAREELLYTSKTMEKALRKTSMNDLYKSRRNQLIEQILATL